VPFVTPLMSGEIMIAASTLGVMSRVAERRKVALRASSVILFIGIVFGFLLAKNISVPVLALRDAAAKVGKGDLTQRVYPSSKDEIGELGIAFNKMVDDLAAAREELEEKTNALINEKKKSDDLLEDLKNTLTNLKETQDLLIRQEKLASIGLLTKGLVDRLLNPLNYINNFSLLSNELVEETKKALDDATQKLDEDTYADVADLLSMVKTNMTKINEHGASASRIVKGMEKLLKEKSNQFVETELNKLIETVLETTLADWKVQNPALNVKVATNYVDGEVRAKILPEEISSVIKNLINNSLYSILEKSSTAVDYTPEITISSALCNGCFKFSVRDNGNGISKKEIEQLFSPFFTTKPTAKGTGLGLYISMDSVKTHKGNIIVESKEGQYAEFIVTIPLNTEARKP